MRSWVAWTGWRAGAGRMDRVAGRCRKRTRRAHRRARKRRPRRGCVGDGFRRTRCARCGSTSPRSERARQSGWESPCSLESPSERRAFTVTPMPSSVNDASSQGSRSVRLAGGRPDWRRGHETLRRRIALLGPPCCDIRLIWFTHLRTTKRGDMVHRGEHAVSRRLPRVSTLADGSARSASLRR